MLRLIDAMNDYAFKKLFARPENAHLLKSLLNALLRPDVPIKTVMVLNPFNEKEFEDDKMTIVDIKAMDEHGKIYQIEVQIKNHSALPERMIFTWSEIFGAQLKEGEGFSTLQPVIAIWLMRGALANTPEGFHHRFQL